MKYTIEELREKLTKEDENNITNLYINGASRDQISYIVRRNKNVIQSYIKWLSQSQDIKESHNQAIKEFKKNKREDLEYEEFRDLYLQGASLDYIRNKFHRSKEYVEELSRKIPDEEKHYHFENAESFGIVHNKEMKKQIMEKFKIDISVDEFFGRRVETLKYNIYCRINFVSFHSLQKYDTGESHYTSVITKGIKSKGDMAEFLSIYEKHYNDIDWLSPPYCKDFSRNRQFSIAELANEMGVS